jgi:hypothetical protein
MVISAGIAFIALSRINYLDPFAAINHISVPKLKFMQPMSMAGISGPNFPDLRFCVVFSSTNESFCIFRTPCRCAWESVGLAMNWLQIRFFGPYFRPFLPHSYGYEAANE